MHAGAARAVKIAQYEMHCNREAEENFIDRLFCYAAQTKTAEHTLHTFDFVKELLLPTLGQKRG